MQKSVSLKLLGMEIMSLHESAFIFLIPTTFLVIYESSKEVSCKPRLARRLETSLPSGPFSPSGTTHSHTPIHARPAPLMPFSTHTA